MDIKTLGIDIGKNKFHLHGVNDTEALNKSALLSKNVLSFIQGILKPSCRIPWVNTTGPTREKCRIYLFPFVG